LRPEPKLEISAGTFSEEALLHFAENCIVPALVEQFLRARFNLPGSIRREHNVDQL
jgi:hypothetical protein